MLIPYRPPHVPQPYVLVHLSTVKSTNIDDITHEVFETSSDSQRRDITEWNKLIEENADDIWVVDTYFDMRSELRTTYRFD